MLLSAFWLCVEALFVNLNISAKNILIFKQPILFFVHWLKLRKIDAMLYNYIHCVELGFQRNTIHQPAEAVADDTSRSRHGKIFFIFHSGVNNYQFR
jgi:hypothetical protein